MSKKRILLTIIVLFGILFFYPYKNRTPIKYVERYSNEIKTEKVPGEFWLVWLYNNPIGKLSLEGLVKRKFVSDFYGKRMDSPKSANKIYDFVNDYNINLSEAQKQHFKSFNDFFYRKLKPEFRPINFDTNIVVSPADGKILVYQDITNQDFIVKGYKFNIYSFLQDSSLAKEYLNGSLAIIRLCPADYHRFHFPVSGTVTDSFNINGDYYSVSPIAVKKKIELFCMNKRSITQLYNPVFDNIIISEIGATMVGSIIQTYNTSKVKKGEEKGYFKFGGSTVVLFFEKNRVKFDEDLIKNSQNNMETTIKFGEQIGVVKCI